MYRLIALVVVQCMLLTGGQVFLKFAMMRMPSFSWSREFFYNLLTNWQFAASGILFGLGSLLWMYIVRIFPFSASYPLVSLSYVLGMLAALVFFHEEVSATKWIGVTCIVFGCFLIAK